jgi:anti-anti-sigma factor
MMQMKIEIRNEYVWITLRGKMWSPKDLNSLQHEVEILKEQNSTQVVMDFRDISFISSQGLGFIVRLADILKKTGKKMVLLNPKEEILELIELSGVNKVVPVVLAEAQLDKAFKE